MHAQIVADPVNSGSNNCLRCHSSPFRTIEIESPLAHGQTPTQVNTAILALTSAQVISFGTATHETIGCAGCHDPHQNTKSLTAANEQFYLREATSSTDLSSDLPGASAAQYTTVNQICGKCHNNRGGDPSDAGLTKSSSNSRPPTHEGPEYNMLNGVGGAEGDTGGPSERTSTHVTVPDQCVGCHMGPNSSHTFVANASNCAPCHTQVDAASNLANLQAQVQGTMGQLLSLLQSWATANAPANDPGDASVWDYTSNWSSATTAKLGAGSAAFEANVPLAVKRARCNYYFVLLDRSYGVHNYVYTNWLLNYSIQQMNTVVSKEAKVPSLSRAQTAEILRETLVNATAHAGVVALELAR
jgi:hypothetical protein